MKHWPCGVRGPVSAGKVAVDRLGWAFPYKKGFHGFPYKKRFPWVILRPILKIWIFLSFLFLNGLP